MTEKKEWIEWIVISSWVSCAFVVGCVFGILLDNLFLDRFAVAFWIFVFAAMLLFVPFAARILLHRITDVKTEAL